MASTNAGLTDSASANSPIQASYKLTKNGTLEKRPIKELMRNPRKLFRRQETRRKPSDIPDRTCIAQGHHAEYKELFASYTTAFAQSTFPPQDLKMMRENN